MKFSERGENYYNPSLCYIICDYRRLSEVLYLLVKEARSELCVQNL